MGLFGPGLDEVWEELSDEINGQFVEGGFFSTPKVIKKFDYWTITLDTYAVSTGKSTITYTRLRAPFINKKNLYFNIYREGIFSGLGRLLGMQDIIIGIEDFDNEFVIKGNNEDLIIELLSNEKVRNLIEAIQDIELEIKDNEGIFGTNFPEEVNELYFSVCGTIKDIEELKKIFNLFQVILIEMSNLDIIEKKRVDIQLK
ncbi:hypothetical protein [Clostridium lundense]|uniref:hypothetical protein n=1 Tax=Clostridium lundense TaxID=319475 RepID=UPI0004868CA3|nr:hypothetical protein [Clostridium lundense]